MAPDFKNTRDLIYSPKGFYLLCCSALCYTNIWFFILCFMSSLLLKNKEKRHVITPVIAYIFSLLIFSKIKI